MDSAFPLAYPNWNDVWPAFVLSHPADACLEADQEPEPTSAASVLNRAFLFHLANMRRRPTLDVDVTSHCNLNCVSCCHYSPVSEPEFLSLDSYVHDLALLSGIEGASEFFDAICLMGGEPLLHPSLADFIYITRRYLPDARIRLVTNGILLDKAPSEVWEALSRSDTLLLITPYPTNLDYGRLVDLAKDRGVDVSVGGGIVYDKDGKAYFLRTPLDVHGSFDPIEAFVSCPLGGTIMQLRDGKIFACNRSALIDKLNKRFGTALAHEPGDYLELGSIRSVSEIEAFRRTPKPLCSHCAQGLTRRIAWEPSQRAFDEWFLGAKG